MGGGGIPDIAGGGGGVLSTFDVLIHQFWIWCLKKDHAQDNLCCYFIESLTCEEKRIHNSKLSQRKKFEL